MTLPRLTSLRASLSEIGDWFLASDPGLNRLLMAARGVAAVGTALGVEWIFSRSTGADAQGTLIAMLLGAIVGMMGSMALSSGGPADKALTAASFPVAIGLGMAIGTAVAANTDLLLWVFVVILFIAVYVRRFGMRFFFAGFMFWMGYFFASFLGATIAQLPGLILDVIVGAATVFLLSLTLLR